MTTCLDETGSQKIHTQQFQPPALTSILKWWWVRVLPPPGSLIWRFPGLIRPRCTAGATHRRAKSYYRRRISRKSFYQLFTCMGEPTASSSGPRSPHTRACSPECRSSPEFWPQICPRSLTEIPRLVSRNGLDLLPFNALLERNATGSSAGLNEIVADSQTLRKPIAKLVNQPILPRKMTDVTSARTRDSLGQWKMAIPSPAQNKHQAADANKYCRPSSATKR